MALPAGGFRSIQLQHELRQYLASYQNIEGLDLTTVTFGKVPFGKWSESETGEKSPQCEEGYLCLSLSRCLTEARAAKHFFFKIFLTCTCYSFELLRLPHGNKPRWATAVILRGSTP
jgi:hypothetical protein